MSRTTNPTTTVTLRVAEAIHAGHQSVVEMQAKAKLTKSQAYVGVRVLQAKNFAAKRQLYRGLPAKYVLVVPIEEIREAFATRSASEVRPSLKRQREAFAELDAVFPMRMPALPQGQLRVVRGEW